METETNKYFYLFALAIVIGFGFFLSIVLIPMIYMLSKNAVHRCSRCLQKMGEKKCFGLPNSFKDEVWQIRFGKCAIVLSRFYGMLSIVMVSLILIGFTFYQPMNGLFDMRPYQAPENSVMINSTWPDFLKDCGGEVIVENYVRARSLFNRKYENNQVMWTGFFVEGKPSNSLSGI